MSKWASLKLASTDCGPMSAAMVVYACPMFRRQRAPGDKEESREWVREMVEP